MHVKTINEYFYSIQVLQLYKYNLKILVLFIYCWNIGSLCKSILIWFAPKLNHIETNQQIPLYSAIHRIILICNTYWHEIIREECKILITMNVNCKIVKTSFNIKNIIRFISDSL